VVRYDEHRSQRIVNDESIVISVENFSVFLKIKEAAAGAHGWRRLSGQCPEVAARGGDCLISVFAGFL
jgi:hypothetical protein